MNGFDVIAIVWMAAAVKGGFRRGLAAESYRLFRVAVALLAGTGLYRLLSDAVAGLLNVASGYSDPVLFVAVMAITWKLLRRLRNGMEALIRARTPERAMAAGGGIAAGIKTVMLIAAIVTSFSLSSWLPGRAWIAEDSGISKLVQPFVQTGD